VFLCLALLLAGCGESKTRQAAEAAQSGPAKEYHMRGEVMGLDAPGHVATIKHDAIAGFMGAMTMGYPVKDPAEFGKLAVGEHMTATLYSQGDNFWIGNIQKDPGAAKP